MRNVRQQGRRPSLTGETLRFHPFSCGDPSRLSKSIVDDRQLEPLEPNEVGDDVNRHDHPVGDRQGEADPGRSPAPHEAHGTIGGRPLGGPGPPREDAGDGGPAPGLGG